MTIEDYMKKINNKNETTKLATYRNSLIKRILLTTTIILILLITCNLSNSAKKVLNKYIFETNYNFAKINSIYKKYILDIPKKVTKDDDKVSVSGNNLLEYKSYKDFNEGVELEVSDNYNVKMLESGLIVYVGEKEPFGNTIIVQQSNGIDVTYGNIENTDIKVYDYIEKGTIIGSAKKKLYLTFTKDGEKLDYKTYIK